MTPKRIDPDIPVEVDGPAWGRVGGLRGWRAAGRAGRVLAVTREEDGTTEVRFGDGQRGLRPPAGSTVKVTYRTGGGAGGSGGRRGGEGRDEPRFRMGG